MLSLAGYQITEKIFSGLSTAIYRGYEEITQKPVILKAIESEYPTLEEISRLRHEYKISQSLTCQGIVKAYKLERDRNGFALILEDFGGRSLKQVISSQPMPLIEVLRIAIAIAEILEQLHKVPIIHKDLNPSNILVNPETGEVKIADLGIASYLSEENPTIGNPNLLEGTLAYISPEQTGRMNRSIDYRTDLYALGATFYEMLTGRVPFTTTEPLELIHCHLAQQPISPHQVNRQIPEAISSIVMKLLAKNAEDRYQSAAGLKVDLETCRSQLQNFGKIEKFRLAQRDIGDRLLIPQKLYGREREVQTLVDAFERVSQGTAELILVSGYSGIGKTSLVNEVHKPIVKARGYFIAGKFDQYKRNIPYNAPIQAFSSLIRQLLAESSEKLALWRENLLEALGTNGRVIIDVIPEVELIIGKQPKVSYLEASEAQHRFDRAFQQFIGVFARPEHPLVLFLDDLQWADSASLQLIQTLSSDRQYLLIIGAYRDNEVNPIHPLMQTVEKLQASGAIVHQVAIKPLEMQHVSQLVADTLNKNLMTVRTSVLAELVFHKTQGNPFFLTQLLKTLYAENLLIYDAETGEWDWDIEQIQAVGITDLNVVELIARNIGKLPATTQQVLKLAACLGNRFSLETLAMANEQSTAVTADRLWQALQTGLILPLSNAYKIPLAVEEEAAVERIKIEYKFLHDRVQQAAYSLISESEKKTTHLKIGRLLLKNTAPEKRKENIFALVNQLNFGTDLLTAPSEKNELAELNSIAAQKAKAAMAYASALNYLDIALGLLETDSWESNYHLTLTLYLEAIEAAYLNSDFEKSNVLAQVALYRANALLEKVKIYELQIQSYIAQNQMQVAINMGLQVLEMLGVRLEQEPPKDVIIENLVELPEMTDPYKLAALRIFNIILSAAYIANPKLFPAIVFTMVDLCIKYGNSPLGIYSYIIYGLFLCGAMGDINSGYQFGLLGMRLLERFDAQRLKAKIINGFNGYIRHWKEHVRETIEPLREAIQSGLENGDLEIAGYAAVNYCTNLFLLGEHLESVERKYGQHIELLQKYKQEYTIYYARVWRQLTLNLLGRSQDKTQLIGEAFNEEKMLPILIERKNGTSLFCVYLSKAILLYFFKDYSQSIIHAKEAEKYKQAVTGFMTVAEHNFYYSLSLLARYPYVEQGEQSEFLSQLEINQAEMENWARHAPSNFKHKYELVEAEKARVLGQAWEAEQLYERAIQGATEWGYVQETALSNELAAEFYLSYGKDKIAKIYLTDAYYEYIRWGAIAKVKDLELRYSQFLPLMNSEEKTVFPKNAVPSSTITVNTTTLDFASLIEASQAISQELIFDRLTDKLMKILLENSGAQTGFLILSKEDKLVIEIAGSIALKDVTIRHSIPVEVSERLPVSVINYVERTQENVILNDGANESTFASDPYIQKNRPKSILCVPILKQRKLLGIAYLENNLAKGAFGRYRQEIVRLLCAQAAISLENAKLYFDLQQSQARERAEKQFRMALAKEKELTELKSRFVSMASHEFRTPLTTILSTTELLRYYGQNWSEEKKQSYYDRIEANIKHMTSLLENVLLVSKAEAGKLEFTPAAIDAIEFCRTLVEEIQQGTKAKQTILFSALGQCSQAYMDERLLRHILSNLLSNAVKYSPPDSTIEFRLTCQNQEAIFQIQDRGIGIPEEDQKQLFESFHRAKNVGKVSGTGLGLAIVKRSVDLHGGKIEVYSQVNVGTTFTVTIPLNYQKVG
jgi:predicted ATPase/signal transduction histidine kinase/tRNA A-37 threonylcarbamoyl transferase component Bud32